MTCTKCGGGVEYYCYGNSSELYVVVICQHSNCGYKTRETYKRNGAKVEVLNDKYADRLTDKLCYRRYGPLTS